MSVFCINYNIFGTGLSGHNGKMFKYLFRQYKPAWNQPDKQMSLVAM